MKSVRMFTLALIVASIAACNSNRSETSAAEQPPKRVRPAGKPATAPADAATRARARAQRIAPERLAELGVQCSLRLMSGTVVRPGVHHLVATDSRKYVAIQLNGQCHAFHVGRAGARVTGVLGHDESKRKAFVIGHCTRADGEPEGEPGSDCEGALVVRELDGTIVDAQLVGFAHTLPMELEVVDWGDQRFLAYRWWNDSLQATSVAWQHVQLFELTGGRLRPVLDYPGSTAFWLAEAPVLATRKQADATCAPGERAIEIAPADVHIDERQGALVAVDVVRPPAEDDIGGDSYISFARNTPGYRDRYTYDANNHAFTRVAHAVESPRVEHQLACWSSVRQW